MVDSDLMDQIKSHLKTYLQEFGRQVDDGNVKCINMKNHPHGDEHPSATYYERETPFLRCHKCGKSFDIFDCAHYLEDMPISGPQFFTETICKLAGKFGITILDEDSQNDMRELYVKYRAYRDAAEYITKCLQHKSVMDCIEERGYSREFAEEHGIGGIDDFGSYLHHMKQLGWDEFYLQACSLTNRNIFRKRAIIFTIYDERSRPIAFAARDLDWKKGESRHNRKYNNSPNSDIYQKGHVLYGIDVAKKHTDVPTYIVEGYTDVTALQMNNMPNVVGIGSVAFTKDHISLLHRNGIKRVVLALDGDESGKTGTREALEKLNTYTLIDEVSVVTLPDEFDPDKYIKSYNIENFANLEKKNGFEWILSTMSHDADGTKVCDEAIPMLIAQPNLIKRDAMIKTLSNETGVVKETIRNEINRLMGAHDNARRDEINKICSRLSIDLSSSKTTQNPVDVIRDALTSIKKVDKMFDRDSDMVEESISAVKEIKARCENADATTSIKLTKYRGLQDALDGFPDHQCMIAIGGKPHVGKTSYIRNIMMDIAQNNEDVLCYFMSIDDSRRRILQAMVAVDQDIPIKYVKRYRAIPEVGADLAAVYTQGWHKGWDHIEKMSNRIIVRDSSHGTSLSTFERTLDSLLEAYPNKKIVAAIDNFHLLSDYAGDTSVARNERKSNRIKELSNVYDIPILMTAELRKDSTNNPGSYNLDSIMGTSQVSYDCDVITFIHNDLQINRESSMRWTDEKENNRVQPVIKVIFSKNKEGDFAGDILYEMRSHITCMKELDRREALKYTVSDKNDSSSLRKTVQGG